MTTTGDGGSCLHSARPIGSRGTSVCTLGHLRLPQFDRLPNFFCPFFSNGHPSTDLQLKRHHQPVKVMRTWPELLHQFTLCDPHSEPPILFVWASRMSCPLIPLFLCTTRYFAKESFVTVQDERALVDSKGIKLLFEEMTFNVVFSRYPCTLEEAAFLAAIHVRLEYPESAPDVNYSFVAVTWCCLPYHTCLLGALFCHVLQ